jgi:hypothetical protein
LEGWGGLGSWSLAPFFLVDINMALPVEPDDFQRFAVVGVVTVEFRGLFRQGAALTAGRLD